MRSILSELTSRRISRLSASKIVRLFIFGIYLLFGGENHAFVPNVAPKVELPRFGGVFRACVSSL